ncbi:MAG: conserved membrane protein of unknown function [Promethearchaeota archaeon]|nr:MAG: conserved membrane protein of unknown function [Candidatus Lokiarchaeota archaeon]
MSEPNNPRFKKLEITKKPNRLKQLGFFSIILTLILITNLFNYLLFHALSELFSIIIAGGIFLIGWNSRRYMENSFFLFLGISFLFVGLIDLIHTISFKGMGILVNATANLPTQLWISARFLQAISFLVAFFLVNKKIQAKYVISSYSLGLIFIFLLLFMGIFPDCYIEGSGLTLFKIGSEYVIILMFITSIFLLYYLRNNFNPHVSILLFGALISICFSEISFTLYFDVYGIFNLIGHLLKIVGFFFIYLAIVQTGFRNPFDLLFRRLKTQEERIKKERDTLLNIFDAITDKIYIVNQNYKISYANPSFINEFGEIGDRTCYKYLHNSDSPCDDCKLPKILKGYTERWIWKSNKSERYYDHIDTPIRGMNNGISKLAILRDITELKKTEKQLKDFVSMVSHELKNPLTVLLQSIETIDQFGDRLQENAKNQIMNIMSKNSQLMAALVEDLLILSRIDDKRTTLDIEKCDIKKIITETVQKLSPLLHKKNLDLKFNMDEIEELKGDPQKLEQIFRIILDNAIKYSFKDSKIKIGLKNDYKGKYNQKDIDGILLSISDGGRGISEEDLAHIFERFYRSDNVKDVEGTGLGLSIAKELVNLHQGGIHVESEYGKGSTFYVFLPKNLDHNKA